VAISPLYLQFAGYLCFQSSYAQQLGLRIGFIQLKSNNLKLLNSESLCWKKLKANLLKLFRYEEQFAGPSIFQSIRAD
jgi:hypothetical protein